MCWLVRRTDHHGDGFRSTRTRTAPPRRFGLEVKGGSLLSPRRAGDAVLVDSTLLIVIVRTELRARRAEIATQRAGDERRGVVGHVLVHIARVTLRVRRSRRELVPDTVGARTAAEELAGTAEGTGLVIGREPARRAVGTGGITRRLRSGTTRGSVGNTRITGSRPTDTGPHQTDAHTSDQSARSRRTTEKRRSAGCLRTRLRRARTECTCCNRHHPCILESTNPHNVRRT
jgi:hypothetical protein